MSFPVDPPTYGLYLVVMTAMAATPGPALLFCLATGVARGPKAALLGVAGINGAMLIWFGAAALGLGAVVKAFPQQFRWLALAGAAYVAWLGLRAAWGGLHGGAEGPKLVGSARPNRAFVDGFAVQLANPKAILFHTAVLPPFVDAARPIAPQLAVFAATTIVLDVAFMSAWGLAGAGLAARFQSAAFRRAFSIGVGALLLLAAALIALRP